MAECSSPQVWAWGRIPLLTDLFFFSFSFIYTILCTIDLLPILISSAHGNEAICQSSMGMKLSVRVAEQQNLPAILAETHSSCVCGSLN